ncbi:MAG TPA: DUF4191 domain-containing protein [Actinobacteria bacterium]|nr:DUF4191 domain-containing protein [Actinomycetota bacterium]
MARNSTPETPAKTGRLRQIVQAYKLTRQVDRLIGVIVVLSALVAAAVVILIGALTNKLIYGIITGVLVGILVALIVFGRRVERAAYTQVEGQPGAAAAVLENARGWSVTPAVQANRQQDLVHRAIGRPGIVLIGEGDAQRVRGLLTQEAKKMARVAQDAPVTTVVVGDGADDTVALRKLQGKLQRLPRTLKPAEVTALRQRMNAIGGLMDQLPVPRGPLPKGARIARPKRR